MFRLALVVAMSVAGSAAAQTRQVALNGHVFTLPEGFTIEVAAGADLAPRPIAAAFDEKGRLYVTDSSGSNEKVAVQVEKKPHRIVRLEDANGDGRFDRQTVFVKNIMFPEGCMWLNGSLYVAAPPHIWKFTDTNDDGTADREEIWFDGKTLTGCANDLHGPYRGPDGWIYWTKGAFAEQQYTVNGKPFKTRAAHIFRARPDGSRLEPVMTGGMDNPVDAVFTPGGDIIFTTTFFQYPANGRRDGLIHAVHGAVYGKDHSPVYEHPWTSPALMPPMTHMGPAAPAGLHRYEGDQFGKDYANSLFACQFNMRKVSRHILVPKGATYETKDSDFVVSDHLDFHPTDVIEDADGSLLIVDTGGWYKLCCPTSQLVKPDVTGAIYRVRRTGAHRIDDPRGLKIGWAKADLDELVRLVDDVRPAVRQRAANELVARGEAGIRKLARLPFVTAYRDETWRLAVATLAGVDHPEARAAARLCLSKLVPGDLAMIGIHAAALWRDRQAVPDLILLVRNGDDRVKRAAAAALGRIGDPKVIPSILAALEHENDRVLDHALTFALIEIGDVEQTAAGLASKSPRVRRACLAALSNLPGGLEPRYYVAELDAKDEALRATAWWVAARNPQWAAHMGQYLRERVQHLGAMTAAEQAELGTRLAPFLGDAGVRRVVGDALRVNEDPGPPRALLAAMAVSKLKSLPDEWAEGVRIALSAPNPDVVRDALAVLRAVPPSAAQHDKIVKDVTEYRNRHKKPLPAEFAYALQAAAPVGTPLEPQAAAAVIRDTDNERAGPTRAAAADLLTRAKLDSGTLERLAQALGRVNPLELSKLLGAFEKSKDARVGLALAQALREPALRSAIRVEQVKPVLDKYPRRVQEEAEKLYAELADARKDDHARLDRMIAGLKNGDIRRGQIVFNSAKAQCIACHKMGYVGGSVGPDLTRIGGIRTERDLLEAIVFPSASFVRSYEPVRVVTTDERTFNGILKTDAPDEIVVIVAADKEERIARADVASITPSAVSVMPSGLDQQFSPQDLADLVAFLKANK